MISYMTFLMVDEGSGTSSWNKVVDIKDFPDMLPSKEALENTTLSNGAHTYEPGIAGNSDAKEFTCNMTSANITRLNALKDTEKTWALWFGGTAPQTAGASPTPTGSDGKIEFTGKMSWGIVGKGVNEVNEIKISIMPSSEEIYSAS